MSEQETEAPITDSEGRELAPAQAPQVPAAESRTMDMYEPAIQKAAEEGDFARLREIAESLCRTQFVPEAFRGKPDDCLVAIAFGRAVGLPTLPSLKWTAVINGSPSLWGDAIPAVIKQRGGQLFERELWQTDTGEFVGWICVARRPGHPDVERTFTLEDAKAAGLLDKKGPWQQYKRRMCQMRARGFACRDQYPDWLSGLVIAEEAQDYIEGEVGPARTVDPSATPHGAHAQSTSDRLLERAGAHPASDARSGAESDAAEKTRKGSAPKGDQAASAPAEPPAGDAPAADGGGNAGGGDMFGEDDSDSPEVASICVAYENAASKTDVEATDSRASNYIANAEVSDADRQRMRKAAQAARERLGISKRSR